MMNTENSEECDPRQCLKDTALWIIASRIRHNIKIMTCARRKNARVPRWRLTHRHAFKRKANRSATRMTARKMSEAKDYEPSRVPLPINVSFAEAALIILPYKKYHTDPTAREIVQDNGMAVATLEEGGGELTNVCPS